MSNPKRYVIEADLNYGTGEIELSASETPDGVWVRYEDCKEFTSEKEKYWREQHDRLADKLQECLTDIVQLKDERDAAHRQLTEAHETLRDIRDNYDHEDQTRHHMKGYGGGCRVCLAAEVIGEEHE